MKRNLNHKLTMTVLGIFVISMLIIFGWPVASELIEGRSFDQVIKENEADIYFLKYIFIGVLAGMSAGIINRFVRHKN